MSFIHMNTGPCTHKNKDSSSKKLKKNDNNNNN